MLPEPLDSLDYACLLSISKRRLVFLPQFLTNYQVLICCFLVQDRPFRSTSLSFSSLWQGN